MCNNRYNKLSKTGIPIKSIKHVPGTNKFKSLYFESFCSESWRETELKQQRPIFCKIALLWDWKLQILVENLYKLKHVVFQHWKLSEQSWFDLWSFDLSWTIISFNICPQLLWPKVGESFEILLTEMNILDCTPVWYWSRQHSLTVQAHWVAASPHWQSPLHRLFRSCKYPGWSGCIYLQKLYNCNF